MLHYACLLLVACCVAGVHSHGRLLDPPARTSCWRQFPGKCVAEYTDTQMNCGGFDVQHNKNGGRCTACGEDWSGPREFSRGGPKYTGFIVRRYAQGQTIDVSVEVTANHLGWFEFSVCSLDGKSGDADEACLSRNLLRDRSGNSRFDIGSYVGHVTYQMVLPKGLSCKHCVLQWKWHCGNSWGVDTVTGQGCVGCGPKQEQFYGCADISIGASSTGGSSTNKPVVVQSTAKPTAKPTVKPTSRPTTAKPTQGSGSFPCTRGDGLYPNVSAGCTKFYQCSFSGTAHAVVYHFSCPANLLFDAALSACNHANQVRCGK